jgi:hypothetical protein
MTKTPDYQRLVDLAAQFDTPTAAAVSIKMPPRTFLDQLKKARALGFRPKGFASLEAQLKTLKAELANAKSNVLTHEGIRSEIVNLKAAVSELKPVSWMLEEHGAAKSPGVPVLFISDLHWGEVVDPKQINDVNEFNLSIAHERMDSTINTALYLLEILSPNMDYPGIVMPLGGDMVTGNIHDELTATNELNIMPTVVDLYGKLVSVNKFAADKMGRVFVPCVTGNHGRNTNKIWSKDRHHTSFDWLLYTFLAKHFEDDKRVTFFIPDGSDAYFRVYEHKFLLTHGDQFRGGDGMIGALGPIIRGDHKKRSRNAQIDMEYDTMMIGHWHQDIFLRRLIVNGSLKGYDEYAYQGNFGFEPPSQQLFVVHPQNRITYRMPVLADRQRPAAKTSWVSIPKAA